MDTKNLKKVDSGERPEWQKAELRESEALDWEDAGALQALSAENRQAAANGQKKLFEVMKCEIDVR